jgi:hypothetical protein
MTAKELIETLEHILGDRDGEDLDVRMDIDFFDRSYGIGSVSVIADIMADGEDIVLLQSHEAADASERYDPRLKIPEKKGLN